MELGDKIRPPVGVTYTVRGHKIEGGTVAPYVIPSKTTTNCPSEEGSSPNRSQMREETY